MMKRYTSKIAGLVATMAACVALIVAPANAQQIETVDPDLIIDGDLAGGPSSDRSGDTSVEDNWVSPNYDDDLVDSAPPVESPSDRYNSASPAQTSAANNQTTYAEDDLIGAAEGVFGRGAEGLARLIEDILKKQGEPNGYIVGREGGGAFILGVRYGSGTLHHKIEGNMPVYWTGPSVGLDAGANAANTFVLVYNLHDTDDLYERYPAGEGQAYLVGGFNVSYLRKGNVVLIPIRVGAGLRLGINAGYMRFSRKQRWLPF